MSSNLNKPKDSDESMYSALVGAVAKRFLDRGVEYDELFQAGYVGLLLARKGFDISRGVPFAAYAFPFIEGEIRNFIRNNRNIRLPRSIMNQIYTSKKELGDDSKQKTKNQASTQKTKNQASTDMFDKITLPRIPCSTISFYEIENSNSRKDQSQMSIAGFEDELVLNMDLKNNLNCLSKIEKRILMMRYVDNQSQSETGKILGIGQSTVSRHEKNALKKLRMNI